jgi:hypothetical protein
MKMPTHKQVLTAAGVLAAVLIAVALWRLRPDPQLARVKAMQQELARAADSADAAERRRRWEEFNREQQKLSPSQRKEVFGEFRKQRQAEIDRYFKMSKADKTRWLDRQIDREEQLRRSRQANRPPGSPPRPPGPGGQGGPGRGNLSAEDRENRRKRRLDASTPEERAQHDQLRKDLAARRAQRGLPPAPFAFGGGR